MSLSSDEVNLLVYRYLQESGFRHSAFTFGHESLLARTPAVESDVPYGSLVGLLQKGLQFLEIERHVREDGTEAPHDHMTRPFEDAKARVTGEPPSRSHHASRNAKGVYCALRLCFPSVPRPRLAMTLIQGATKRAKHCQAAALTLPPRRLRPFPLSSPQPRFQQMRRTRSPWCPLRRR